MKLKDADDQEDKKKIESQVDILEKQVPETVDY